MKLKFLLTIILFTIAIFAGADISAHTINRDMEKTYIEMYMPILFLVKLLPFIALGMLSYQEDAKGKLLPFRWIFFIALGVGVLLGFLIHYDIPTSLMNGLGVLLTGILLIFSKVKNNLLIKFAVPFFGLVLGVSYGGNFLHAENLWWFYALTLCIGSVLFIFLSKIQFIGNPRYRFLTNVISIIFILSGIVMVLLS